MYRQLSQIYVVLSYTKLLLLLLLLFWASLHLPVSSVLLGLCVREMLVQLYSR